MHEPERRVASRDRVAAIVLAAGSATRMGRNKMLLELEGDTVLRRAVGTALAAGLEPVLVVLGHERERTEAELEGLDCRPIFNAEHEQGIHTSVRCGIRQLPDDVDAAIVMLADMPYVSSRMLSRLVRRYRQGDAPLVISRYGGEVQAPPMLYDRTLFPELAVMERRCGREVIRRHKQEAEFTDWPERALTDLDRPEDYERVRAELPGS